ncbi:MAG TPA: hypothetical protein VFZ61_14330, partial [Polyangiales bacterium]
MTPPPPGPGGGVTPPSATADSGVQTPPQAGPSDAGTPPGQPAGEWCKVKAVLDKHCTTCHDGQGSFGSPFGLTTYADVTKDSPGFPGKKIYERMGVRLHDTARPMPPQGEVSAADKAVLDAWIAAKAPGSASETCAPAPDAGVPGEFQWPADCEEKYKLLANDGKGGKFTSRKGQYYQDFFFKPPWTGDVQSVGFRAVVDNKKVLHHYIVYQDGAFLVGWSPGKNDHPLPPDVGVFMPATGELKMTV